MSIYKERDRDREGQTDRGKERENEIFILRKLVHAVGTGAHLNSVGRRAGRNPGRLCMLQS